MDRHGNNPKLTLVIYKSCTSKRENYINIHQTYITNTLYIHIYTYTYIRNTLELLNYKRFRYFDASALTPLSKRSANQNDGRGLIVFG